MDITNTKILSQQSQKNSAPTIRNDNTSNNTKRPITSLSQRNDDTSESNNTISQTIRNLSLTNTSEGNYDDSTLNHTNINNETFIDIGEYDEVHIDPEFISTGISLDEAGKIAEVAHMKNKKYNETLRRYYGYKELGGAYFEDQGMMDLCMDLMKQSIYATRIRLQLTRPVRQKFSQHLGYNFAILYGSLMQIRIKLDNMIQTLRNFNEKVKFMFYIILYERILATTIDIDQIVARMFEYRDKLIKMLQEKKKLEDSMPKSSTNKYQKIWLEKQKKKQLQQKRIKYGK